ncbi:Atxe2 family lasso peptide isopeptidase [Caulobacter soli]|uniref:Atxe2 family lasso peptide isopeptidase n=1 Tax=Caulobacter soli TaxID=2708539 RepID=UPI0013EA9100|nr:Atxe2 family lasso peptide isopeptidase [Caulobacter soli]
MVLAALLSAWPAAAGPGMRDLIETVDISSLALSPDGRRVVFRQDQASIERNRQDLSWWIVDLDGKTAPRRLADGGDALWRDYGILHAEAPRWSPDSRSVYFRALIDGAVQVWRAPLDGGAARRLTRDPANVSAFGLAANGLLVYAVGATRDEIVQAEARQRDEGVRIDASVDPAQNLFAAIEIEGRLASQRFVGRWFDRAPLLADQPRRYLAVDPLTQAPRAATSQEVSASGLGPAPSLGKVLGTPTVSAVSPAGRGVAQVSGEGAERVLQILRPEGGRVTCPASACRERIESLAWRGDRDEVILSTLDAAKRQTLLAWRVGDDRVRTVATGEGLLNGGGVVPTSCAVDDHTAVCVVASAAQPPRLVAWALDTGAATVLAEPNRNLAQRPATVEALTWRDKTGRLFTGQLVRPGPGAPATPWPLFVTYYRCAGFLRGGEGDEWPLSALADGGVAALCINKTPSAPGVYDAVADYNAALSGVAAAIDLLSERGLVDRSRVGMGGLSFGSEVTTWIAARSNLLAAASIASTQIEPTYYWINAMAGRDVPDLLNKVWGLGPPDITPEAWRALSPAFNVDKIRAPMLIQTPEQEYRLIPEFIARLSRSTTPSEVYAFPNEAHILVQPRHRAAAYARNLDWFRFWLQDHVDPDPAKSEQYARWRAMKSARPSP